MLVERGRLYEAREALENARAAAAGVRRRQPAADGVGGARARRGRPRGRRRGDRPDRRASASPMVNPSWLPWRAVRAEALLHAVGRADEALAVAEEDLGTRARGARPGALGRALRTRGAITGDRAAARRGGRRARRLAGEARARPRARRPRRDRRPAARAASSPSECGAVLRAAQIRDALRAAGVEPPAERPAALTETERRALALADEGARRARDRAGALPDAARGRGAPRRARARKLAA